MIRFATRNDIYKLMKFINNYWREGHILARDRSFFEYEHCDGDNVNFVISIDDNTGDINGMQGFIPYGKRHRDITKNLWRAVKSLSNTPPPEISTTSTPTPHLGTKILEFLIENADARTVASIGSNPRTLSIYRRIGFHVGELCQWYRLNPSARYIIADIANDSVPKCKEKKFKDWVEFYTFRELSDAFDFDWYAHSNMIPFKEKWYIEKRYYKHPIFKYRLFGIRASNTNTIRLVLVFRVEHYLNSKALRLIDCIGDYNDLQFATENIDALMKSIGAEYVDFYESGLDSDMMKRAGWQTVCDSGNIIPNYFAPYEKRNIQIHYASSSKDAVYFKGDGDQDRPN